MTRDQLFELQSTLVGCLTDPDVMSEFRSGAPASRKLSFLDLDLVQLLSSLYQGKRLDKLTKVFPKTLDYLAPELPALAMEFLKRHPPLNADSYTAGCQFYAFLKRRWRTRTPTEPFVPELAYCELARVGLERQNLPTGAAMLTTSSVDGAREVWIRRRRGVRLCASEYDIRPLFEPGEHDKPTVVHQRVWIVLSRPLAGAAGRMYGVDEKLFALLTSSRRWTPVSLRSEISDRTQTLDMLRRLEQLGFLEVDV